MLIVTIAVLLQLAIFFSIDNLIASALVLCGAFVGIYYAVDRRLLDEFPLSTLAVIGYTVCHFVVPPLGKLADFQSIIHGLNHPIMVWVYGFIGMLALVLAHYVYRMFSPYSMVRWSITSGFYRSLHFFDMPDQFQFWLMGIVGIAATVAGIHYSSAVSATLSSVTRVLSPLIYTPFFASFPTLIDPRYPTRRRPVRLSLIVYSVLVLVVATMVNSRGFMVIGFASLACVYGYRVFTGTISHPRLNLGTFMAVLIGCWLVIGPMTNLAAAMLISRAKRRTVSSPELARETWRIYRNDTAIKVYEMSLSREARLGSYSEAYYNNMFLNRFGNMRFTDLSIDAAHGAMRLGRTSYFQRVEFQKVVAILPAPVIRLFHLDIDKKEVLRGSSEDFLVGSVGGFLTGEPLVILRMTFGMMWPIYFGFFSTVVFVVLDASCDRGSLWNGNKRFDCVVFNPVIAAMLFGYVFYFAGFQDFASIVSLCTRDWIVMGLLYAIVFVLTKGASSLTFGRLWRQDTIPHSAAASNLLSRF